MLHRLPDGDLPRGDGHLALPRGAKDAVALYIVGEFDLTHGPPSRSTRRASAFARPGSSTATSSARGLFYEERRASEARRRRGKLDAALDRLSGGWRLRRYPWAGALSTAHTVLRYERLAAGRVPRASSLAAVAPSARARRARPGALRCRRGRDAATSDEVAIWRELVQAARRCRAAALPRARQGAAAAGAQAAPLSVHGGSPAGAGARGAARATAAERVERRRVATVAGAKFATMQIVVAQRRSLVLDPVEAAHDAGLRWICDDAPGIRRVRAGKGFRYVGPDGKPVRDARTLARIRQLAIPPAWTRRLDLRRADGHMQATGRDARGRKQYRYHARGAPARRDQVRPDGAFGRRCPSCARGSSDDLASRGCRATRCWPRWCACSRRP